MGDRCEQEILNDSIYILKVSPCGAEQRTCVFSWGEGGRLWVGKPGGGETVGGFVAEMGGNGGDLELGVGWS